MIAKSGLSLSHAEHEDALAHLLGEAFQLAERYDASRGSFSNHATRGLRTRLVDWQRQRLGRTKWQFKDRVHIRERPVIVSLDDDVVGAEPAGSLAEGAWATVNIGWPLSSGASMKELSAQLGESQKWLEAQLERLQRELVRLSLVTTDVEG